MQKDIFTYKSSNYTFSLFQKNDLATTGNFSHWNVVWPFTPFWIPQLEGYFVNMQTQPCYKAGYWLAIVFGLKTVILTKASQSCLYPCVTCALSTQGLCQFWGYFMFSPFTGFAHVSSFVWETFHNFFNPVKILILQIWAQATFPDNLS